MKPTIQHSSLHQLRMAVNKRRYEDVDPEWFEVGPDLTLMRSAWVSDIIFYRGREVVEKAYILRTSTATSRGILIYHYRNKDGGATSGYIDKEGLAHDGQSPA